MQATTRWRIMADGCLGCQRRPPGAQPQLSAVVNAVWQLLGAPCPELRGASCALRYFARVVHAYVVITSFCMPSQPLSVPQTQVPGARAGCVIVALYITRRKIVVFLRLTALGVSCQRPHGCSSAPWAYPGSALQGCMGSWPEEFSLSGQASSGQP